jgi:hypothetical protein
MLCPYLGEHVRDVSSEGADCEEFRPSTEGALKISWATVRAEVPITAASNPYMHYYKEVIDKRDL